MNYTLNSEYARLILVFNSFVLAIRSVVHYHGKCLVEII